MIGESAGHYRILESIAEGGMARVFRGEDRRRGRAVALKMLRPELARESEPVERFRAEADLLSRLRHPNIIRLHEFFQDGDRFFMVMEYARGETLAELLAHYPDGMPWREGLALILPLLSALEHIHERGIVHRDIKPANLLVQGESSIKLTDFGIARARDSRGMTRIGYMAGTLKYMSPEQIQAKGLDGRSDLYSTGLVLYELLSGCPAFDEPSEYELIRAQMEAPPPPLRERRPELPPRLESAVLQALGKDPAERFDSARKFRNALEEVLHDGHGCNDPSPAVRPAPREVLRSPQEPTVILPFPAFRTGLS